MKDFLVSNWGTISTILLIALLAFIVIYRVVNKQWDKLRLDAYSLIRYAEKSIRGSKRGLERMDRVFNEIYWLIPGWLQFFVSQKSLREKLQKWFDEVKDFLDDGKINGSLKTAAGVETYK